MVVGIRFAADSPVRTVLQAVLPIFSTVDVDFLVREYWVCTFGNGLPGEAIHRAGNAARIGCLNAG